MRRENWYRPCAMACAIVALCLGAASSHGAVTADPARLTFVSPDQSFTIQLVNDGVPIPAIDIRGWQLLASGHDYKHMVDVERMNGGITISPSSTVELGSYDLNIDTTEGSVIVQVLTPLSEKPDIVEKISALTGQSEQKIAEKLGLTTTSGRSEIEIDLPSVYYEGQTLEFELPSKSNNGHTCMWFINGDAVAEGPDQYAFTYTFLEPGDYVLTFIETAVDDGKPTVVARAKSYTRVVPLPLVLSEVAVNTVINYVPPTGYQNHAWSVDGEFVSEQSELEQKYLAPGVHLIECLASAPDQGPAKGFLRIRFQTTVLPA